jgi:hypothetical protein
MLLLVFFFSAGAMNAQTREEERVTAALEKISTMTPEGHEMLIKVQKMKPEVNECLSTKTLIEMVKEFSTNKGDYNIFPIGWFVREKKNHQELGRQILF